MAYTPRKVHTVPETLTTGAKRCARCNHMHNKTEFHKDKTAKDGVYSICKWCKNLKRRNNAVKNISTRAFKPAQTTPQSRSTPDYPTRNYNRLAFQKTKTCTSCGKVFMTAPSATHYNVCGECHRNRMQQNKRPAKPPKISPTPIAPAEDRKIAFDFAIQELVRRHKTEFNDIYLLALERIAHTRSHSEKQA